MKVCIWLGFLGLLGSAITAINAEGHSYSADILAVFMVVLFLNPLVWVGFYGLIRLTNIQVD